MSEWKEIEIGNLCDILSSKRIFASDYVDEGVPFYRSKEIIDKALGQFSGNELFISKERYNKIKSRFGAPKKGDLLISAVGNRSGIPYCVKEEFDFYFKDGNLIWFKNFGKNLNSKYLEYYLSSKIGQNKIESVMIGSAQKALTISGIKGLKITIPPLSEQKAIAHILGTLVDKIELNRQINQTLEAMAQALFKSWFVAFDPVIDNAIQADPDSYRENIPKELQARAEKRKGLSDSKKLLSTNPALAAQFPDSFVFNETLGKWIPEGWEVKKLQELVNVKYGKDHKKLDDGEIPCYGSGGIMRYVEKALFEKESVLIPRKGTLNNIMYINKPFWSVDTMFFTEMKQKNFVKFFFYEMGKLNFSEMNEGSAVPSMTTAQLNSMDILVPSINCLSQFDKAISQYFKKKEANEAEIETLSQLRDRLLPELISGRLSSLNFKN